MSFRILVAAALLCATGAASAQPSRTEPAAPPTALTRVFDCRGISATQERLACYDREVAAMASAQASGDLVAVDRQQVRRTRRSLFGLALPDLGNFGDGGDDEEGQSRVETTLRSARQGGDGKWMFETAEGARWAQIDSRDLNVTPRAGQPIRIRRAAMGSYLANVNNLVAIRVRRVQ
jgi:hypothetical protein